MNIRTEQSSQDLHFYVVESLWGHVFVLPVKQLAIRLEMPIDLQNVTQRLLHLKGKGKIKKKETQLGEVQDFLFFLTLISFASLPKQT